MTEQHGRGTGLNANENGDPGVTPEGERRVVTRLMEHGLSHPLQATDYDTSWGLRLTEADGAPVYPHLLGRLLDRQHEDGSWGGQVPHAHDRLLSTLAVVVAVSGFTDTRTEKSRAAGELYLRRHLGDFDPEGDRTIGFELTYPALLEEAAEIGLDLPFVALDRLKLEREAKLSLLPEDIFRDHTTVLFSLEAFRHDVDVEAAAGLQLENGSMANSPSATAYLLGRMPAWRERMPRSVAYLEGMLAPPGAGLPPVHPCEIFVRAWTLYYLQHGGLFSANRDVLEPHLDYLREKVWPDGVWFSASSGSVDSDDTAVTLLVLHRAGYEADGSVLLRFEGESEFLAHRHESNPSVSTNLHILEALATFPKEHCPRVKEKILPYLLGVRRAGAYWRDKWHASAYYPTSMALNILAEHAGAEVVRPTLDWILAGQRPDGSWGEYMPTTEETSLVLLSLLKYHREVHPLPEDPMRRAAAYLAMDEGPGERGFPELWIGKSLYAPGFAIEAAKLSALALYEDTFGSIR